MGNTHSPRSESGDSSSKNKPKRSTSLDESKSQLNEGNEVEREQKKEEKEGGGGKARRRARSTPERQKKHRHSMPVEGMTKKKGAEKDGEEESHMKSKNKSEEKEKSEEKKKKKKKHGSHHRQNEGKAKVMDDETEKDDEKVKKERKKEKEKKEEGGKQQKKPSEEHQKKPSEEHQRKPSKEKQPENVDSEEKKKKKKKKKKKNLKEGVVEDGENKTFKKSVTFSPEEKRKEKKEEENTEGSSFAMKMSKTVSGMISTAINTLHESEELAATVEKVGSYASGLIRTIVPDTAEDVPFPSGQKVPYSSIEPYLQTGDIILMSGNTLGSSIIKTATNSKYSHVAMVIRIPPVDDTIFCWESSTNFNKLKDVEDGKVKRGVSLLDLRSKMKVVTAISFRKLRVARSPELLKALLEFRNEMKDVPYETNAKQFISSAFDDAEHVQDISSVFCSELMAEAYKRMGLLPDSCTSSKFTPQHFANDDEVEKLLVNCKLEKEVEVSLEEVQQSQGLVNKILRKKGLSTTPIPKAKFRDFYEIEPTLQTGDIVLFSNRNIQDWGLDFFGTSKYTHVGLILRINFGDSRHEKLAKEATAQGLDDSVILVFEASRNEANILDIEHGEVRQGVQIVSLREKITSGVYDRCAIRRLRGVDRTLEMMRALDQFRKEVDGRPYETSHLEMFKAWYDGVLGENKEDLSSLFCSELVAEAYKRMKLLPQSLPSNEYTPKDFAGNKLQLENGASLEYPPTQIWMAV